jgi:hypothetical protein
MSSFDVAATDMTKKAREIARKSRFGLTAVCFSLVVSWITATTAQAKNVAPTSRRAHRGR